MIDLNQFDLNQFDGHSPGPLNVPEEKPTSICNANGTEIVCGLTRQDAKLFSAAPDLLAECKRQAEVIRELTLLLKEPVLENLEEYQNTIMNAGWTRHQQAELDDVTALIETIKAIAKLEGENNVRDNQ